MPNLNSIVESRSITLPTMVSLVKAVVFQVVMYRWESCSIKNPDPKELMLWTVVLEKTLESSVDWKEVQPVHPKGNQAWIFIGKTDVEAETLILWPPDAKSWLIWKDADAGKHCRQEEKGTTGVEMVLRESVPRQVDEKSGLPKGRVLWGSWGGDKGLDWTSHAGGKDKFPAPPTFLSLSCKKRFYL